MRFITLAAACIVIAISTVNAMPIEGSVDQAVASRTPFEWFDDAGIDGEADSNLSITDDGDMQNLEARGKCSNYSEWGWQPKLRSYARTLTAVAPFLTTSHHRHSRHYRGARAFHRIPHNESTNHAKRPWWQSL